jgi:RNA polymerase sigma-70 factor, ECF subfamily
VESTEEEERFADVLRAAQAGDERAIASLFTGLQPRLLRFLRAQEPRAADDLAGDVWLGIAKGLRTFEGDSAAFRSWAFSIARRRLADHRRTAMRRPADLSDGRAFESLAGREDPEASVVSTQSAQDAVDLIVRILPPEHAEVVLLRVLGDLDAEQVAELLGRTAGWVRVTQHRSLKKLADRLGAGLGVTR